MEDSHGKEHIHLIQRLFRFFGVSEGDFIMFERFWHTIVILRQHHRHIEIWEEGVRLDADSRLVALFGCLSVTLSLLDYSKVVVDPDFVAEIIADI